MCMKCARSSTQRPALRNQCSGQYYEDIMNYTEDNPPTELSGFSEIR
jgi:hypothetical protein